jgi:Phosphoribosylanthranilate isomerase
MFIKVCGMRQGANVQEVARLKPDLMGFIFYPKSKRFVGEDFDPSIIRSVMPEVQTVGVFVNEEVDSIISLVRKYSLDFVQLHGNESPASCQMLRDKGIKVLKAFGIHNEFDWTALEPYTASCDYFLFDTSTRDYGGSGVKFDWNTLNNYKLPTPFVLSGGIGPEDADVIKSIKHPQLEGIDINSRFEVEPGLKDAGLLQTFITKVRTK